MTSRLELNWKLDSFVDEQRYYCSETPIDVESLPSPKAILLADARTYTDTDIDAGKTYYVRIGSVKNGVEKFSNEIVIFSRKLSDVATALFSNSEKGLAVDFTDISTLFQDLEGAVPIIAAGQQIAFAKDLSGHGAHLIQPDPLKRPVLEYNSTTKLYNADFSGNKSMWTQIFADFNGSNRLSLFASLSKDNSDVASLIELTSNINNPTDGGFVLFCESGDELSFSTKAGPSRYVVGNISSRAIGAFSIYTNYSLPTNKVQSFRKNGVEQNLSLNRDDQALTLTSDYLYVGARGGSSLYSNAKYYSIIAINRETTELERDEIETLQKKAFI